MLLGLSVKMKKICRGFLNRIMWLWVIGGERPQKNRTKGEKDYY